MILHEGQIIDGQVEDGDPDMESSRTYQGLAKFGKALGSVASSFVRLPGRVNNRLVHFIDELDRASGR